MEESRLNDYDLKQIMEYENVKKEDVKEVLACIFGENDGPGWHYILEMKDGSYIYLTGWCDYTGWGCQDGSSSVKGKTLDDIMDLVQDEDYGHKDVRRQLQDQIDGKQPYGLQV